MRVTSDCKVKMPCCKTFVSVEELAENIQESSSESEETGRLVVRCTECSELVDVDLTDPND